MFRTELLFAPNPWYEGELIINIAVTRARGPSGPLGSAAESKSLKTWLTVRPFFEAFRREVPFEPAPWYEGEKTTKTNLRQSIARQQQKQQKQPKQQKQQNRRPEHRYTT